LQVGQVRDLVVIRFVCRCHTSTLPNRSRETEAVIDESSKRERSLRRCNSA
jgi:hypothetical protein